MKRYAEQPRIDFRRIKINRLAHAGDKPSLLFGEALRQQAAFSLGIAAPT
jgi:hypothetical protein